MGTVKVKARDVGKNMKRVLNRRKPCGCKGRNRKKIKTNTDKSKKMFI